MIPGGGDVDQLYALTKSAVETREKVREALDRNQVAEYHRLVRTNPEYKIADGLLAARRTVTHLVDEQRAMRERDIHPDRDDMEQQQIQEAIAQVAGGSVMWAKEYMAGARYDKYGNLK